MQYEAIKDLLVKRTITVETALEKLADIGYTPNLLYDDNGHWAVKFDGFQTLPMTDEPQDIGMTFMVEAHEWKDSVYDALIHALN